MFQNSKKYREIVLHQIEEGAKSWSRKMAFTHLYLRDWEKYSKGP